mmetsp:Transcript_127870/g.272687  ORF Transcript_127870/g.272687 Transcript_127870/m.272687 type:complete len:87 (+) Transcript_127870:796-1056(+)
MDTCSSTWHPRSMSEEAVVGGTYSVMKYDIAPGSHARTHMQTGLHCAAAQQIKGQGLSRRRQVPREHQRGRGSAGSTRSPKAALWG